MPEYLHPGVFVEEVSSGVRPIEGVGTSTAAFVGITGKGVPNKATFITSWQQYVRKFGGIFTGSYLPYALSQFFNNGGKRCYIVRALNVLGAVAATRDLADSENPVVRNTLRITANGAGTWGNGLLVTVQDASSDPTGEFKLTIALDDPKKVVEVFDNLSMDPSSSDYVETSINGASEYITVKNLGAAATLAKANRTTTVVLADPVPFAVGGETLIIEMPDGSTNTVKFANSTPRKDAITAINTAWAALNVSASLDAANHLVVTHNVPGFDKYFILSGTATAGGRPLAGIDGFAQGSGPAIGGTLKSLAAASFNVTAANNTLKITVHGDPLPDIKLSVNAAHTTTTISSEINASLAANARGLVRARTEGNRVVITTTNAGAKDSSLSVAGTGDGLFRFRRFDRSGASGAAVDGQGGSQVALVQSAPGDFTIADNSDFTITVNNGTLAADVQIQVTLNTGNIKNLTKATGQEIVNAINNATNAAGNITATLQHNRVVIQQARRGNFYTLRVKNGLNAPNIRLKFSGDQQHGFADGDASSSYVRPAANFDANGVLQPWTLLNGDDGAPVSNTDLLGNADLKSGLHALDDVTDVNFIAIPGSDSTVAGGAVGYCSNRRDCFFIADSPEKKDTDSPTTDPATAADYLNNKITPKNSYGALYYPWLLVSDEAGVGKNPTRYVPPSGFVAGMYARIDNSRGVWKAAAGTEATVTGPIDLEYSVTDSEQDILNPIGVNCIRQFPASGIVIWGARTLGAVSDPEWRYIPVRRYAIYLEQSIYRGTQWAVFEPNDQRLWGSLKANIEDFLMGEFRKGALAGTTPQQAFSVKCDIDLNPQSEVDAGRVNMEVKFAPLKPAEFVVIRISQKVQRPGA